ncbi:MAG: hypothetical protein P8X91_08765 [Candidatus Bathyarchaeota archaeon]
MGEELEIGKVIHFFGRINVAIIELKDTLSIGDKIAIIGPNTDFEQTVESMEIEHVKVTQFIELIKNQKIIYHQFFSSTNNIFNASIKKHE